MDCVIILTHIFLKKRDKNMGIDYTEKVKFKNGFSLYELQRHMERAADVHSKLIKFSRDDLMASINAFWVLLRIKIYIDCDMSGISEMEITTWHYKNAGVMWYRGFEFYADGKKVGSAVTAWAILDADSHRILRPNSIPDYKERENSDHGEPEILKKTKLSEDISPIPDYIVTTEDIDINEHMNNARYTRLAENVMNIPKERYSFEIDYINEAKQKETISLRADGAQLRGTLGEKECFNAKIILQ